MNLTPADLGTTWERKILEARLPKRSATEYRQSLLFVAGLSAIGLGAGIYLHDALVTVGGAMLGSVALLAPPLSRVFERQQRTAPLTEAELTSLKPTQQWTTFVPEPVAFLASLIGRPLPMPKKGDGLEESFASLVGDLARLDVSEESVASELKRTLKALGDAVSDLPPPAELPNIDIADLVADAEALLIRAKRESDDVVAESLQRQAEATVRRARATADAMKLARRTRTLRQEVLAQIEGCRAALPALARTSGAASSLGAGRFSQLAEQVQGVAREAASVAAAQEELAQAVGDYAMAAPEMLELRRR